MQDTHPDIQKKFAELICQKSPEERFLMGLEMIESGREFMIAGIKMDHPEYTADEINRELLRRFRRYDPSLSWLDSLQR
ncbi:MAG: hypothetical protein ABIJ04_09660 [Bacteroidota bacterium]